MTKGLIRACRPAGTLTTLMALLPVLSACGQQQAAPSNPPLSVLVEKVALSDYAPATRQTGEIQPRVQSDLSFQIAGRILERSVSVGDHVVPGQVLAKLDPVEKEADVRSAVASVSASEAVLRQAESTFDRQQALLDQRIAIRKDYDAAQESLRTAEAALDVAKTELETAREQLSYTVLRAEKPGVITALDVEVGQVVQAAETVYSLAEDGPRDAVFDIDEALLGSDDVTPEIKISLVSDPSVRTTGKVRQISPTIDEANGTVRVKVDVEKPPAAMTLGAAVVGEASPRPVKAIMIPTAALFSDGGKPAVWVVDAASRKVSLEPITVKSYESDRIVVGSGLHPDELIVSRGAQLLHPDQIVDVTEEAGK
jgi:RND family efflux transporter MFP subunit